MGGRRPREHWPSAPAALSPDSYWTRACERGLRELRPTSSSMNTHKVLAALPAAFCGELTSWFEGCAHRLIQHTARSAPVSLSERLEEEWLADLAARRGQVSRLRLAIGCCWATRVIAYEHSATGMPAAGSATGNKVMTAYARHNWSLSSPRTTAVLLIACLHGVLIYFLATGLVHKMAAVIPPVIQIRMTDE